MPLALLATSCTEVATDSAPLPVLAASQNKNSEFCAPLTSFDWNETDPKRLGTSSIDTTCTIWDIEVSFVAEFEEASQPQGRLT